jgi:hypothetical protein
MPAPRWSLREFPQAFTLLLVAMKRSNSRGAKGVALRDAMLGSVALRRFRLRFRSAARQLPRPSTVRTAGSRRRRPPCELAFPDLRPAPNRRNRLRDRASGHQQGCGPRAARTIRCKRQRECSRATAATTCACNLFSSLLSSPNVPSASSIIKRPQPQARVLSSARAMLAAAWRA